MNKVDVGNLDPVEDVRFLHCSIPTVLRHNKTVPYDEWTFVDRLQRQFKLASLCWGLNAFYLSCLS
jgi:hypothetical protein